jgi:hypothetical protein
MERRGIGNGDRKRDLGMDKPDNNRTLTYLHTYIAYTRVRTRDGDEGWGWRCGWGWDADDSIGK